MRRVARVTALIVTLSFAGGIVALARYQPVSVSYDFDGPGPGVSRASTDESLMSSDLTAFIYRDGGDVYFGGRIVNGGRFSVTIESVLPLIPAHGSVFQIVEAKTHGCCGWDGDPRARPFRPFRLKPGGQVYLMLRATMKNCELVTPGMTSAAGSTDIVYSVLGSRRTLEFDPHIAALIPPDYRCPRKNPYVE